MRKDLHVPGDFSPPDPTCKWVKTWDGDSYVRECDEENYFWPNKNYKDCPGCGHTIEVKG